MNRKGFTGLEIVAVIFLSMFALKLTARVVAPKTVKKAQCSAAAKRLQKCGEKKLPRGGMVCEAVVDETTNVILGLNCQDAN